MGNGKKEKPTGKFRYDHLNNNNNNFNAARIAERRDKPISSTLNRPDIHWLQKEENRTRIEGGQGNLWVSNKPLLVTQVKQTSRSMKKMGNREKNKKPSKILRYVVVGMQGDQIHHFHGAYREKVKEV